MQVEKLRQILFRRPFKPVRIILTSGDDVELHHPEGVIVTQGWVMAVEGNNLSLVTEPEYIAGVEFIRSPNGAARRRTKS